MEEQRLRPDAWDRALAEVDGRQLVVAGPGAGKTEFLLRRVKTLVDNEHARPDAILLLSFSRRSSRRLEARLFDVIGGGTALHVSTFHSLANRLIEAANPADGPTTLTAPEQVAVVHSVLKGENPSDWPPIYRHALTDHVFAREIADFLMRCSERLLTPESLAGLADEIPDWQALPALFGRYLERLESENKVDYGTVLTKATAILGNTPELVPVDYVLVDEYQDTTSAQAAMADKLAAATSNITVAGDPYQSIYSFRGADLENIHRFSLVPNTKRWVLTKSFRVPAEILEGALRVVSSGDLPGSAGAVEPADHKGAAEAYVFDQETAEAEWIASEVERLIRIERVPASDIAVAVRSKREFLNEMSRALSRRDVPHDPPSQRLIDHPAVRLVEDTVTAATLDLNETATASAEADAAVRRILLGPSVRFSISKVRDLERSRASGDSRWSDILAKQCPELRGLIGLLVDTDWAMGSEAALGFWEWWTHADGIESLVDDPTRSDWRRVWTALGQMLQRQSERDPSMTLNGWFSMVRDDDLESTPLLSLQDETERVTLSTLHQIKGLSFDTVFIPNASEGVFPDLRRSKRILRPELLSGRPKGASHQLFALQEEMRLAYTALTRARRRVVMTATDAGVDQGERRPSRFMSALAASQPLGPPAFLKDPSPISIGDAEARLRRCLFDTTLSPVARLAALAVLAAESPSRWNIDNFAGSLPRGAQTPVLSGKPKLSPSQAESYATCPRRYVLQRRLRIGDSDSVWATFGTVIHRILERAENEVVGTGKRHADLGRVLEILDEEWADLELGSPGYTEGWRRIGIEVVTKLYEKWPGKGIPFSLEHEVELEIDDTTWVGTIDRIEAVGDAYRVIDYKTGTTSLTNDEAAESIQLGLYTLAVEESLGEVTAAEMWYPRSSGKSVRQAAFAIHNKTAVSERLKEISRGINEERWEPTAGKACSNCPFLHSCPAWPQGREAYLP